MRSEIRVPEFRIPLIVRSQITYCKNLILYLYIFFGSIYQVSWERGRAAQERTEWR